MAFPVLLKIGRIVNITIYLANYAQKIHSLAVSKTPAGAASVLVTSKFPNVKIEWFFQIFDDAYSSLIFLLRLHIGSSRSSKIALQSTSSFGQRLKTLFWISVTNFVFPVMLSIAQLVIYMASSNYLLALYVEMANFHLTIIGVAFATLWSTADGHVRGNMPNEPAESKMSAFVARVSVSNASGATSLDLQEPREGHAGRDEEKAADASGSPYRLEVNTVSRLDGSQGLTF
ncbi:hypothetical protein EWM64_g6125 [Hericium alpestre]|uniref:Uncharacterized protein n=1 Tax=Hericium alpestre TaxID=135208 RepID=A0A4Y9ZUN9_9AGAM|nr:hypothetical protein EWM64_g6125 [Hericium alpestre]